MTAPLDVAETCLLPLTLEPAYERTIAAPLPQVFAARHLALPAIAEVTDQDGAWGSGGTGQSRRIHLTDGGVLRETLTRVDPPFGFGYRIDVERGAMKPLVDHLDGLWRFEPVTDHATRVIWSWDLHPRSAPTWPAVRAIAAMWPGYARKALLSLERVVTIPAP